MLKRKTFCLLIFIIMLLAPPVMANNPNIVTAIDVTGNNEIPAEVILEVVQLQLGAELDSSVLQQDLQRIFDLGWFFNVGVDFKPHKDGVMVVFEVRENFKVAGIIFNGVEVISVQELEELMRIEAGALLNTRYLEADLRALEEEYQKRGYILTRIRQVFLNEDSYLEITINEGTLGKVYFLGNEKTRDYVIEREIDLEEGEVFNVNEIQKTLQNIYFLGFFSENINTRLEMADPEQNIADIYIELEEIDTGQINFGGGYNTQTGWFGYLQLEENNLFGRGQEAAIRGDLGFRGRSIDLRFNEPYFLGSYYSLGTGFYWNYLDEKDRDKREQIGGNLTVGRPLTDVIRLSSRLRLDWTREEEEEDIWQDWRNLRSITLTGTRNTTDTRFNPREGGRQSLSYELAGFILGGSDDFHKIILDLRQYFPGFTDTQSWAFRLRGGIGFGPEGLPFYESFRLGGSETLRGYDFGTWQGDRMLLFNGEYRFNIYKVFDGAVFVDSGTAWLAEEELTLADVGLAVGAGIRLNTPLGQLRFDLGLNRELELKPHFSIGQTF